MKRLFGFCCLFLVLFSCRTQESEKMKKDVVVKSDKADIVSYMIKNRKGGNHSFSIDNVKGILTLTLPNDHEVELDKVMPTIVISNGAKIFPTAEKVCDFSADKTVSYTLTSESGKTKQYVASVKVLEARKNLEIESIKVHGKLVENKKVTIGEEFSTVEKLNVEVKFKENSIPQDFFIKPEILRLNSKGDSGVLVLSTPQTDVWNAWSETIEVTRGGEKYKASNECKILTFEANGVKGIIDHDGGTVSCVLPSNSENNNIAPLIKCSDGALILPNSGEKQDFSKGPIDYIVTAEDGTTTKRYKVTVEKGKSNIAEIVSFKVGSVVADINNETGKITTEVEKTVQLNMITPSIELSKGAKVSPTSGVQKDFTNSATVPVIYTVTAEDEHTTKTYSVTITHKKSSEARIISFKIGSIVADINQETGKITAEVEKSISLDSITPEIKVSDGARVTPESNVVQNFTSSVIYTVTAENGTTTKKYEVTITHKKSNIAMITSFVAVKGDVNTTANINQTARTIYAEVPFKTDLSKIKPVIICDDYGTCTPKSEENCDFSDGKTVKFTVKSEDEKVTKEYTATVKRLPPPTTITIFDEEAKEVQTGEMAVEIPKEKDEIKKENIKLTYKDGSEIKEIGIDKISIEGDQSTLAGPTGSMVLKIILNLGHEFIANASMRIKVTKK